MADLVRLKLRCGDCGADMTVETRRATADEQAENGFTYVHRWQPCAQCGANNPQMAYQDVTIYPLEPPPSDAPSNHG